MSLDVQLPAKPPSTSDALSKRLGSLQAFQARIAQRVALAQSEAQPQNNLLSLQLQGFKVLISLTQVNELLSAPELTALPLAKRWVRGLTVVRSEVVTVFDLAYCIHALFEGAHLPSALSAEAFKTSPHTAAPRSSDAKLVMIGKTVAKQLAFEAERVLGTLTLSSSELSAAYPDLIDDSVQGFLNPDGFVKGVWRDSLGDLHLELSLPELFRSPAFARITL